MKKFIVNIMPEGFKKFLKGIISNIEMAKIRFFGKNPMRSHIYYSFFSKEFINQHYAVFKGKEAYINGVENSEQSLVLLRRNTHRLEKGLIMRPRRSVFAADYILETTLAFETCVNYKIGECEEVKWAHDVLKEYFSSVDYNDNKNISDSKAMFELIKISYLNEKDKLLIPYKYSDLPESKISYSDLGNLFLRRRSVRWFEQVDVQVETLEEAIMHASLAPSACNRQPFRYHAILCQDQATEFADIAMGTKGFSHNIPAMIAVVGDLSAYPFERDRNVIYIDGSLSSMQLMLSLETLGLSSCPINWPDMPEKDKKITEYLQLKPYEKVIMLIAVGYADKDGLIPFSQKKTKDSLLKIVR
ncbi:nitroreductase family protein [Vibrio cyclitrophicus]|uniref:nitroreductase family protein n=1 Tax=Vibrio cyclitrophicus TaxID=47951 RepID=UPI0039AF9C45